MPYPPRVQLPGQLFHVFANGVDGCFIFRDDDDFHAFCFFFEREVVRSGWVVIEYTVMGTHYHALLQITEGTLSSGFQHLQSLYARWFNKKYGRRGAVWQKRFDSKLIESEQHLYETIPYIAWNAPKAERSERPEDYGWCSYGAAIGVRPADRLVDEEALLGWFGGDTREARRRLRALVEDKDPRRRRVA